MYFLSKGARNIWLGGTIPESHEWDPKEAKHNAIWGACLGLTSFVIKINQKQENWALGLLGEGLVVSEHIN